MGVIPNSRGARLRDWTMETKHHSLRSPPSQGVNEGEAYGLRESIASSFFFSSFKPIRRGVRAFVMGLVLPWLAVGNKTITKALYAFVPRPLLTGASCFSVVDWFVFIVFNQKRWRGYFLIILFILSLYWLNWHVNPVSFRFNLHTEQLLPPNFWLFVCIQLNPVTPWS